MADEPGGRDLHLRNVTKRFGSFAAVDDLSLTIPSGSFFALLGPSGCGKTTTLRMVTGLEEPSEGSIHIGDADVTNTKSYRRPVNTVFQSYALFPHLTIFENVAFGLRRRRAKDVDRQVQDALDLVELSHLAGRKPRQLSGGQEQRVALARAIVNRPALLLLDEPLGALDLKLRRQMQIELKRIQTEVGLTFVHVTHDQEEAMTMADTIAVMNEGRIQQLGNPAVLYESPRTAFVANFLGQSNLLRANLSGRSERDVSVEVHGRRLAMPRSRCQTDSTVLLVGIRPEKINIIPERDAAHLPDSVNVLADGVVTDASFTGMSTQYLVRMAWDQEMMVFAQNVGAGRVLPPGTRVTLHWDPVHTFALDGREDIAAGVEHDQGSLPATVGLR